MNTAPATCGSCGAALQDGDRVCRNCGAPVNASEETPAVTQSAARPGVAPPGPQPTERAAAPAGPPPKRPKYPEMSPRRRVSWPLIAAAAVGLALGGGVAAYAFLRNGDGDTARTSAGPTPLPVTLQTATVAPASPATVSPTPGLVTPIAQLPGVATGTATAAAAAATATARPTAAGTPAPRNVGGLTIVDETWVGRIVEPGGLRIRSAPRVEPGNVVGSLPDGALVNVTGRVLNGQEAEPGKGTVWLIVGVNQYIYAPPGYVEMVR